ncbi:MAG TPA: hypothetical protein DCP11_12530, partial [Microbacteriaceae bacterium]|nr:hypothetical protein [Microbacteriaceae bacterium]
MTRWIARQWGSNDRLLYVLTALVTGVLTTTALELWAARLTVPLTYWGDALATADHFKTVMETGWFTYQPLLGAPYGQTYSDFPTAENLNFMAAGVFGFITRNYMVAMNLYYFFGFIAAALTALWLFRRLGISKLISLVLSALFALAPYHFIRGESHLFLASYYIVPLSVGIVVMAIRGEPLWTRPAAGSRWYRWLTSRAAGTLLILILSATAETYYAVFFLILLAFSGVVRLIRTGEWRRFWGAAIAGGVTAFALFLNTLPATIYAMVNGQDPASLVRARADTEVYALKLSQLLLPWSGNRIPILRHLRELYDQKYPLVSESPALGAVAAVGLVALLLVVGYVIATAARPKQGGSQLDQRFGLLTQLAALVFVAFLFSTIGGLSTLISFLTSSLRGWNRMSIYITVLCLAAVGILLDAAIRWLQRTSKRGLMVKRMIAFALAVVVLGVGYIDQTPSHPSSEYSATISAFDSDSAWFAHIDRVLPAGAEVLQLPYQPFPESVSVTGSQSSDVLLPFLHTTDIRWSGGGIKGRPRADWPGVLEQYSPADIVTLAAASGFSGIHIDLEAMENDQSNALVRGLTAAVGSKPVTDSTGRFLFYDLLREKGLLKAEYPATLLHKVEAAVVNPVVADTSGAFTQTQDESGNTVDRSTVAVSPVSLTSASSKAITATLIGSVHLVSAT